MTIGGYLGAGKTTLLNRLLRADDMAGVAVIVNDFGTVGIDAELLRESADGRIQSLANGCVCCSFGDDFAAGLDELLSQSEPVRWVIVEASGVATPANLRRRCNVPGFRSHGCLVIVDGDAYARKRDDRYVGSLLRRQVAEADWLYLNRSSRSPEIDSSAPMLTDEQVAEWRKLAPGGSPVRSAIGETPFVTVTAQQRSPVERRELHRLLAGLPEWVERVKGFVESEGETVLVQQAGSRFEFTPAATRIEPSLVFIAPATEAAALSDLLESTWSAWRLQYVS